jgi:hypothetical protein
VEQTNGQPRIVAAPRMRNGFPPSGGYVYRGTGEDTMPWAITDNGATDYDTGIGKGKPRLDRRNLCALCGHDYRTRIHRAHLR